ncbi:ATP-binding protein, partial [bacterium]|nr:ATP-binding protein [bacterium]
MENESKLIEILLRKEETKEITYKAPCGWNPKDKAACCELVKDILAFGNTLGGYLIIGVNEIPNGFDFAGLSDDQLATYDTTKINQFINKYADPPTNTTVNKVPYKGRNFVI